ncbi:hypothetical protein HDV03_003841 [Kappamyces sp. JEL0829]|nr:hypothetical protein HDV03_003841 [Kappamyces sp. JEL0829]
MDVGRENFPRLLPGILEAIREADFCAFDLEFTGLGLDKRDRINVLDTVQERYEKLARVCSEFLPLQVGICTFKFKADNGGFYVAKPFNFHVFPQTGPREFGLDRSFSAQVSSLEFLLSNKFDLKKWAEQGISYVNWDDQERILSRLDLQESPPELTLKDGPMYTFVQDAIAVAAEFMQSSTEKSLLVPCPSGIHKRALQQAFLAKFNGFLGCENKRTGVEITKLTQEERAANLAGSKISLLRESLHELVGFRRVIDAIVEAKVPLVGHNLMHDLCFIYHNFYRFLPEDFDDFKQQVHENFPLIFDTKLIAQHLPDIQPYIKNTVLSEMAEVFQKEPFQHPKIVFGRENELYSDQRNQIYHEAGYDAYVTGLSLLRIHGFGDTTQQLDLTSPKLLGNKVFLMQSMMNFINFDGPDGMPDGADADIPDTTNVFIMRRFPVSWKTADILSALKDLGFISYHWVDDQSCVIVVKDLTKVPVAEEMAKKTVKKSSQYVFERFTPDAVTPDPEVEEGQIVEESQPSKKRKREALHGDAAPGKGKGKKPCLVM